MRGPLQCQNLYEIDDRDPQAQLLIPESYKITKLISRHPPMGTVFSVVKH